MSEDISQRIESLEKEFNKFSAGLMNNARLLQALLAGLGLQLDVTMAGDKMNVNWSVPLDGPGNGVLKMILTALRQHEQSLAGAPTLIAPDGTRVFKNLKGE